MAWIFFSIMLLMGGLLVFGATGDLVSAGRYDLLFGPNELARSITSLGDMVDAKKALQSALVREYAAPNTAEAIQSLSDRYNAWHPVTLAAPDLYISTPINNHNPLDGVVAGSRVMQNYYAQLYNALAGDRETGLH